VKKTRRVTPKRLKTERAREFRVHQTAAERIAWRLLRNRRCLGLKFRRQWPLDGFIVDFYCYELELAIELDGPPHDDPARALLDRYRGAVLQNHGIRVIRIKNAELSAETLTSAIDQGRRQGPLSNLLERGKGGEDQRPLRGSG